MIPLKLTIEGLYSYQERQIVDFTALTEAGLFGVFGAVGSGKSSILEAISFALFGETERLNARDRRSYNMMNLKSSKSYIEFDFINFENKVFRATREFRRNARNFEQIIAQAPVFYEILENGLEPLDHTRAEDIIGLTYENFKRTIIIPQGQFKEFLELGATERTKMMKEIFNLHQYDLQDKTAVLVKKNTSELDQLAGKLTGFEGLSPEKVDSLEKDYAEDYKKLTSLEEAFAPVNEYFQKLKLLKSDYENLSIKKADFHLLEEKKSENDDKITKLDLYEKINTAFRTPLNEKKRITNDLSDKNVALESLNNDLKEVNQQLANSKERLATLKDLYEAIPNKRKEENDLRHIIDIQKLTENVTALEEQKKNLDEEYNKQKEKISEIDQFITEAGKKLAELASETIDSEVLMNVGAWFSEKKHLVNAVNNHSEKIKTLTADISSLNRELEQLEVDPALHVLNLESEFEKLKEQKSLLLQKKSDLEVKKQLSNYTVSLHDGGECPLCGSLEHPHIIEIEDVSQEFETVLKAISAIDYNEKKLQNRQQSADKIFSQRKYKQEELNTENEKKEETQQQHEKLLSKFCWDGFDRENEEDYNLKRNQAAELRTKISEKQTGIEQKRLEHRKISGAVEESRGSIEKMNAKLSEKQGMIAQSRSQLQILNFDDCKNESVVSLESKLFDLKEKNDTLENDYKTESKKIEELSPKISGITARIDLLEKDCNHLNTLLKENQDLINRLLLDHAVVLEEVTAILTQNLDVRELRQETHNFVLTYENLKNAVKDLEERLSGFSFDRNEYDAAEQRYNTAKNEVEELGKVVLTKKNEIDRLKQQLVEMNELLQEKSKLEARAANLEAIRKLFISAGFVQYASSIYLRNLCDQANERFHKMTRNQLSLHLSDYNEFEIIDYLNDGKARSVKTLSGGQSFQVSLSLALALAESVQSNAAADRNFFFIDEGFGTQDQESVNIVFETLMNLQKENRIVGIISHVEELKEKIPVSLSVVKHPERGSLISVTL